MSSSAYAIGAVVGVGGMGIVSDASHPAARVPIVIKVLRPELTGNPAVKLRFAAEVRAVRRLDHPNIVRYVDSGEGFLVMERVAGAPLGAMIETSGPFSLPRVLSIGAQLLAALAHAHAHGVIHADVKSDNLLVDTTTGADLVTLVDFGVARILRDICDIAVVKDPMMSGTPEYMAPEVIRGELPTAASDLYAVGVILYELLTGTTPFGGGPSDQILLRHLEDQVVPPSLRCPSCAIPTALERIVMRALDKDPGRRFSSARTFAAALHDAARGIRDVAELSAAEAPQPAFSTEAPTRNWSSDDVPDAIRPHQLARGTRPGPAERTQRVRAAIGDAIVRGDVCDISAGYLELARVLVNEGRLGAAVAELDEALDLLSAALPVWPILLSLAALHDGLGDRARAYSIGCRAHDDAARAGSSIGTSRAATLLARLDRRCVPIMQRERLLAKARTPQAR